MPCRANASASTSPAAATDSPAQAAAADIIAAPLTAAAAQAKTGAPAAPAASASTSLAAGAAVDAAQPPALNPAEEIEALAAVAIAALTTAVDLAAAQAKADAPTAPVKVADGAAAALNLAAATAPAEAPPPPPPAPAADSAGPASAADRQKLVDFLKSPEAGKVTADDGAKIFVSYLINNEAARGLLQQAQTLDFGSLPPSDRLLWDRLASVTTTGKKSEQSSQGKSLSYSVTLKDIETILGETTEIDDVLAHESKQVSLSLILTTNKLRDAFALMVLYLEKQAPDKSFAKIAKIVTKLDFDDED